MFFFICSDDVLPFQETSVCELVDEFFANSSIVFFNTVDKCFFFICSDDVLPYQETSVCEMADEFFCQFK